MLAKTLFATILASAAIAAPTTRADVQSMAAGEEWTVKHLERDCNKNDTKCTWTFGVDNHKADKPTNCTMVVKSKEGKNASHTGGGPAECDPFTITSGWDHRNFTVLSIVNREAKKIAWAGYGDDLLEDGSTNDRSWPVSRLDS